MAKTVPPGFPQITIEVERALTAVAEFHPDRLEEAYTKIYHKSFVDLQEVHKFEHIRPVLAEMFGEAVADELISQVSFLEAGRLENVVSDWRFRRRVTRSRQSSKRIPIMHLSREVLGCRGTKLRTGREIRNSTGASTTLDK